MLIWGQSIGAGVATGLTAAYVNSPWSQPRRDGQRVPIDALILETPFTSVEDLLLAFYPQKWLPYRYLGPFLRSHWDSMSALQCIAQGDAPQPTVLIVEAANDEVVPPEHAEALEMRCRALGIDVQRKMIPGALHSQAALKRDGQLEIARFLRERYSR